MLIKAFRLFISSTFADFAVERDVLQGEVFPALDAYCTAKGYQFYPLDLRWGVNEEAQLDQRTAEICLGEVRAAKQGYPPPNFLIMIGNRYGLVPLPYAIAADEFTAIVAWLEERGREDAARAISAIYRYDGNHLVPRGLSVPRAAVDPLTGAYTLCSRLDDMSELRPAEAWAERESELRPILQEAASGLAAAGRIDEAAHEKYFLSLTDQEIICGLPGYRPSDDRAPPSSPGTDGPAAIAFIRTIVGEPGATPSAMEQHFQRSPRLDALKAGIRRALPPDHIIESRATFGGDGSHSAAYLTDFAARISAQLRDAIDRHAARVDAIEQAPDHELESERSAHRAFAQTKLEVFVGRDDALAAIARYLGSDGDQPLILHGRSGLGKSALMARASADAEAKASVPVVARFVGASAQSANQRALLVSLIEELAARGVAEKTAEIEQDSGKFNALIENLFATMTIPAIVFLDAIDQLQKPRDLSWLPVSLPKALKLVISVLDDAAYGAEPDLYQGLRHRLAPEAFLEVGPLSVMGGRELLTALETQGRHRLQDGQRNYIIQMYNHAGGSPLYLKTAFEIARSWKSYQAAGVGRCILAFNSYGVIAQFIAELSGVHHHEPALVSRTLGYLAAAKDGLSAKELNDILSRDGLVMRAISSERFGASAEKLPPSVWVRLHRDLASFLVEKQIDEQPLLQFFHRQVAQVARVQYYERRKAELHAALASYFESQVSEREGRRIYAKRALSELPYQLHHADSASRLGEIMMSPDWMHQKLAAFGIRPLVDDYQYARTKAQRLTGQALDLSAGALARDKRQLAAQMIGRIRADLVAIPAEAVEIERLLAGARAIVTPPAFIPRWPFFTEPGGAEVGRFEAPGLVYGVAFSPDGRHIVAAGSGGIRLWEAASGREVAHFEPAIYANSVAFSPDGRQIVSGSHGDKTLQLWDAASGRELAHFEAQCGVCAVAVSPDGRHIVSGGYDGTARIWELASRRELARFEGHSGTALAVAFSPDGRHIVSGGDDGTARLWEVASGRELVRFGPHVVSRPRDNTQRLWESTATWAERYVREARDSLNLRVRAVAFSPDGSHVISGPHQGKSRLWKVASGREIAHFETGLAEAIAFSPDGRYIVSVNDLTVRLWEVASGGEIARFIGHTSNLNAVAFSPDGRHIVSAGGDGTVRLWEVASEQPRHLENQSRIDRVLAIAFSPDGQYIISGSYHALRLLERAGGREVARFKGAGAVLAVALSADGRYIVGTRQLTTVILWEVASQGEITRFKDNGAVLALAFAPDGRHIVTGSADGTLRLWDLLSGHYGLGRGIQIFSRLSAALGRVTRHARRFKGHTGVVLAVAFSPDGRHIVSAGRDGTVRLWEVASRREIARFEAHTGAVLAVAFSPDGRHIVSASEDRTVRLWDPTSGGETGRFAGHSDEVRAVGFSPDGRNVVSGSRDRTLRLWEVASGRELARIEGDSPFNCIALAHDGCKLAAGDEGGYVHLFDILVHESDKSIWLGEVVRAGAPAKPPGRVRWSPADGIGTMADSLAEEQRDQLARRRFFAALSGKSER